MITTVGSANIFSYRYNRKKKGNFSVIRILNIYS